MKLRYLFASLVFLPALTMAQPFQSDFFKLVEKGNEYYENQDYENAKTSYQDALLLKPESAVAQKNLALSLAKLKEQVASEEEFERFSTLTESQIKKAEAEYNIGKLKLDSATAAYEEEDNELALANAINAVQHFTSALDFDPTSESAKTNRAQAQHLLRKIAAQQPPPEQQNQQNQDEQSQDSEQQENQESDSSQSSDNQNQDQNQSSENQQSDQENQDSESNENESPYDPDRESEDQQNQNEQQQNDQESQEQDSENEQQQEQQMADAEQQDQNQEDGQSMQGGTPVPATEMTQEQAEALLEMLGEQQSLVLTPPRQNSELVGELNW